jgi:uncharacterized Ntn-hydrolase superfamily protein
MGFPRQPLEGTVMTFSIIGRCEQTGMLGAAICSAIPGVGGFTLYGAGGVGIIATQSMVNPYYGIDGLTLLREGKKPESFQRIIQNDLGCEKRQVSMIDAHGNTFAYTGQECMAWFGHHIGKNNCIAAANMMVDATTVSAMVDSFEKNTHLDLCERLLNALVAGDGTPGDFRGRQSTALLVYHTEEYPYCSIRVDEHKNPITELQRIFTIYQAQMLNLMDKLPSQKNVNSFKNIDDQELQILLKPVKER